MNTMLHFTVLYNVLHALVVLVLILLVPFLLFYWYEMRPYTKLPTCHFFLELLPWLIRRNGVTFQNIIFQKLLEFSKRHQKEGLFVVWLGKPNVYIYGEEIVQSILKDPAAMDKPAHYEILEYFLGRGLLTRNGEEWKKQRRIANPSFYGQALKENVQLINKNAEMFVKLLNDTNEGPVNDILKIIKITTSSIFFESIFGIKPKKIENMPILEEMVVKVDSLISQAANRMYQPWMHCDFLRPFFLDLKKDDRAVMDECYSFLDELLEELVTHMNSRKLADTSNETDSYIPDKKRKPLAETLIEEYLKGTSYTKDDLLGQITTLIIAGYDTVSHTVMWILFMLALHPNIQDEVYNEIMSMTKDNVEYDDLSNLVYLECVLKEVQRIYTTVPIYGRFLKKDMQFGKYKIKKNSTIGVFTYALHRNPDIYPDPEKFDPQRFWGEDRSSDSKILVPFAEGIRPCIGKNFALIEIKILMCYLLRNFRVTTQDCREDASLSFDIMLSCTKQPTLQFIQRKSEANILAQSSL